MKWLLIICYFHLVSSSLYILFYSYSYTYFVVLSFVVYAVGLFNKETDDAFFQQELGWSVEGSLGWTRIVGRLGCRLFELFELR